jgi:hypothetical protein
MISTSFKKEEFRRKRQKIIGRNRIYAVCQLVVDNFGNDRVGIYMLTSGYFDFFLNDSRRSEDTDSGDFGFIRSEKRQQKY